MIRPAITRDKFDRKIEDLPYLNKYSNSLSCFGSLGCGCLEVKNRYLMTTGDTNSDIVALESLDLESY